MLWLNLKETERKLSANKLDDTEGFKYLLGIAMLICLGGYAPTQFFLNQKVEGLDFILSFSIMICGLVKLFKTNNLIDGKHFYNRLFAISWVIGWCITVFFIIPIGIIAAIFKQIYGYSMIPKDITSQYIQTTIYNLLTITYFILINNSFKRLNPHLNELQPSPTESQFNNSP